jgi:thiol:disulfide interchange protein
MQSKFFNALLATAFVSTVVGARVFSWIFPRVHWEPVPGMHIHHYVYGIFILTAAGYLALIFKGERSTLWIALLYGLGVGLTFDEFGMWLNPPFVRGVRWNTNGIAFVLVALVFIGLIPVLRRNRSSNISDSSKSEPQPRQDVVADFSSRS